MILNKLFVELIKLLFHHLSKINLYVPKVTDVDGFGNTLFSPCYSKVTDVGELDSTLISPLTPKVTLPSLSSPKLPAPVG